MMNDILMQQSDRLNNMADFIKVRLKGLDDIASNNVISELKEIADIIKVEARKQNTIWSD